MYIKEHGKKNQLSIGFKDANHDIVKKNPDLHIYYKEPKNFKDNYIYISLEISDKYKKYNTFSVFGIPHRLYFNYQSDVLNIDDISYPREKLQDVLNSIGKTPISLYQQYTSTEQGHDIIELPNAVLERVRQIEVGKNWTELGDYSLKNKSFNAYRRLDPNTPAPRLTNPKTDIIIHPFEDRIITPRETAMIQGFPAHYEVNESMYQDIVSSVPPIIGYYLGGVINNATN